MSKLREIVQSVVMKAGIEIAREQFDKAGLLINQAEQQILALIPKEQGALDPFDRGFNHAIQEIKKNMGVEDDQK